MTKNKWDISIEVESNFYNWMGEPVVTPRQTRSDATKIAHIDLFSGCGGFSAGFELAGMETSVALDLHPPSIQTLKENHKAASTILGDIRKVTSGEIKDLMEAQHPTSIVTAGVPCQGFSLSNRKRHADDQRNFLFLEFIRIVTELRPEAVVLENVSGLVSTKNGAFKRDITMAIESLGYDVHFAMLNAADYGVPQFRRRVFFVGVPRGSSWLFPAPTFGGSEQPFRTVGEAILGDLPRLSKGATATKYSGAPTSQYQEWLRQNNNDILTGHSAPAHPKSTVERIKNTKPGAPMYEAFKQRIRLHSKKPSPTQICGGIRPQFQFGHPAQARGLTIRERARIQSFQDDYVFSGGVTQGRVQTGNAVPPLLAMAIANQLRLLIEGHKLEGINSEKIEASLF
jgi:DNA (cytosine-5)-methyltransferase 1